MSYRVWKWEILVDPLTNSSLIRQWMTEDTLTFWRVGVVIFLPGSESPVESLPRFVHGRGRTGQRMGARKLPHHPLHPLENSRQTHFEQDHIIPSQNQRDHFRDRLVEKREIWLRGDFQLWRRQKIIVNPNWDLLEPDYY